ncbi:hypothetical protein [Streptomyces sp. NPDC050388]|uniref:hypothetical protein n=1 Tax=Streptomyces sp. NPDC050388 TaxID=3155781 RepID=UPI0034192A49
MNPANTPVAWPPHSIPSAYQMRSLGTAAERTEAAALAEERQRWLTLRGLPVPARADVPALFRHTQRELAGLFEDDVLIACMILQREPDLGWGADGSGPCLFLGHVHTLPGRSDDAIRLVTLWASDYAARLGLPHVRAEALALHDLSADPIAGFLHRLRDMGWAPRGSGAGQDGERVARLELAADLRPGLTALIGCSVREPQPTTGSRSSS